MRQLTRPVDVVDATRAGRHRYIGTLMPGRRAIGRKILAREHPAIDRLVNHDGEILSKARKHLLPRVLDTIKKTGRISDGLISQMISDAQGLGISRSTLVKILYVVAVEEDLAQKTHAARSSIFTELKRAVDRKQ